MSSSLAFAALLFFRLREQPATSATAGSPTLYNDDMLGVSRLDTDKAIAQFETRMKEDPRDFISLTILGQLYAGAAATRAISLISPARSSRSIKR